MKQKKSAKGSTIPEFSVKDTIEYSLRISQTNRDSIANYLTTGTGKQDSLLKDLINISIPIQVGAISLLALPDSTIAQGTIKTPELFIAGIAIIAIEVIIALAARNRIVRFVIDATVQAESAYTNLAIAARAYALSQNQDTINALVAADNIQPTLPPQTWLIKQAHVLTSALFVAGFVALGTALLFHIST